MTQQPPARAAIPHTFPWAVVICGCLIAALKFGPRSAMGFFQLPVLAETGWDRTTVGLATPVFTRLADGCACAPTPAAPPAALAC